MLVNAPPMIIPTAISITFPRQIKFLNSAINFFILVPPEVYKYMSLALLVTGLVSFIVAHSTTLMKIIFGAKKVSLGVFENNESAYYCYKSVGFKDITLDEVEKYNVLGEEWKCLELEVQF